MKIKCLIILILSLLMAASLHAQELKIPPNVDGINQYLGLKIWGSNAGKVALSYNKNTLVSYSDYGPYYSVVFMIFDMVNDKIIFSSQINGGEEFTKTKRLTIEECYALMGKEIVAALKEHNIHESHETELLQFPMTKGNITYGLSVKTTGLSEFFDSASDETFGNIKTTLTMTAGQKSKIITKSPIRGGATVLGYIASPFDNRVLIVLGNVLAGYNETELEITGFTGCHLDVGFK